MRSLMSFHRTSLWPVLTLACGLLAGHAACRGEDASKAGKALGGAKAAAAKVDKQKTAEDSTQKSIREAQAAYEKQQRRMKERFEKDPLWQPSHQSVAVIKPGKGAIESFCRNKDGNLLICCRSERSSVLRGTIVVVSPEGKKITEWKVPFQPQVICLGKEGAIYVAGGARIAKLDQKGKVIALADAPNASELPPLQEKKEPKDEAKKGPEPKKDDPAAEKAKKEKIADLQEKERQAQKDLANAVIEERKKLKPDDKEAMQAYQKKIVEIAKKLAAIQRELRNAAPTAEMQADQEQKRRQRMATIAGIAVTDRDLFVSCASAKGYGYVVWRTDHNFAKAKKIVEKLSGCCGQMDIQAHGGDLWVAHNARHKVEHYDRDGKKLGSFGKTDRVNADGFGGCCEPKNLRFGPGDIIFAAESGPPTCVKRFSLEGKFLGMSVVAPWNSGCVRVTTEYDAEHDRFFVLNSGEQQIHVFTKKSAAKKEPPAPAAIKAGKDGK